MQSKDSEVIDKAYAMAWKVNEAYVFSLFCVVIPQTGTSPKREKLMLRTRNDCFMVCSSPAKKCELLS
jgi:hypothetical protein